MNLVLPLIAIAALAFAATKQATKKAIEKISVTFKRIKLGLPPKIVLSVFNPTPLKVEITFIRIGISYRGTEVVNLSDLETRVMNPGENELTLTLRPSLEAISLIFRPQKGTPKTIRVNWEIGTKLYSITGEKQTTL